MFSLDYDLDDPLAGLGLSDDDDDDLATKTSKVTSQTKKPLSRRLSTERSRIEPKSSKDGNLKHGLLKIKYFKRISFSKKINSFKNRET